MNMFSESDDTTNEESFLMIARGPTTNITFRSSKSLNVSKSIRQGNFNNDQRIMNAEISKSVSSHVHGKREGSELLLSATDIAMALQNIQFNEHDMQIIEQAYKKLVKKYARKRFEKRRKLFLKRKKSGSDSGELGGNSSISSNAISIGPAKSVKNYVKAFWDCSDEVLSSPLLSRNCERKEIENEGLSSTLKRKADETVENQEKKTRLMRRKLKPFGKFVRSKVKKAKKTKMVDEPHSFSGDVTMSTLPFTSKFI